MKKVLSYNHTLRIKLQGQGFGWFNTDPSVKVSDVKKLVPDYEEQLKMVASGTLDEVDLLAPTLSYWAQGENNEFLGYVKLRFASSEEVITKLWPKLEFTAIKPE